MTAVLEAHDLHKTYVGGDGGSINVLNGVDIALARREMVAVVGASGAGKSTMLHVLGALDKPTRGYVVIGGEPMNGLDEEQLAALRNRSVGFVFQFHHLLREFTALENVMMPLRIGGRDDKEARDKAAGASGASRAFRANASSAGESFQVVSSSEPQLLALSRWIRRWFSLMSRREISILRMREMLHELLAEVVNDLEIGMIVVTHNRGARGASGQGAAARGRRLSETVEARRSYRYGVGSEYVSGRREVWR